MAGLNYAQSWYSGNEICRCEARCFRDKQMINMDEVYQGYLYMSGEPCGPDRIAEIERNIGRELPRTYAEFIMETGGGYFTSPYAWND